MTAVVPFADLDASMRSELPELGIDWQADATPAPELVVLNARLAEELGLDPTLLESDAGVQTLAGNDQPPGAHPIAMGYAGHQFGSYSPRLGDGRALLLGELTTPDGTVVDVHLKGSGRTPFSRGGDGKATLGPMLREFVIAEAMHALGVPTGRALAVVSTGEQIMRQYGPEPGAVLTRVASSHLRVGTFEYAARMQPEAGDAADTGAAAGPSTVERLADFAIARHDPDLIDADDRHAAFYRSVIDRQAALIAKWMALGFIHGVMNTDNMLISGETIDYGPCAFMDAHDPATVFSSIDHTGRYAFGNQPRIAMWNLARLGETLVPLLADDEDAGVERATELLNGFSDRFAEHGLRELVAKLGLAADPDNQAVDGSLVDDLFTLMVAARSDHSGTFRALAQSLRGDAATLDTLLPDSVLRQSWIRRWHERIDRSGDEHGAVADAMDAVNPIYIPRNHLVEAALAAAVDGDPAPFEQLLQVVTDPFVERPGLAEYAGPAPDGFSDTYRTFCGT